MGILQQVDCAFLHGWLLLDSPLLPSRPYLLGVRHIGLESCSYEVFHLGNGLSLHSQKTAFLRGLVRWAVG